MIDATNVLRSLGACDDSVEWLVQRSHRVAAHERKASLAWAECPRGDWLLWIAARAGVDRRIVVMAACACAREALRYVPAGELRPLHAIETAEAWCRSEATTEQVGAAASAARYARYAAASAARYARYAAAYAYADARYAAAAARYAYAAAYADAAAAARYADAAAYADRTQMQTRCADIVRKHIAWSLVREKLVAR